MNERLAFIDWMKVIGMGLIVWGHTGSDALVRPTEPFNPKQLGVAFFVFVLGFSLAREKRPRMQVLINRLLPISAVGLSVALLLSVIDVIRVGDLRESNYLPLAFGINVLFDFFPANPTTWFIGTYTHIIFVWALLLHRVRFTRAMVALLLIVEIFARALLMKYAGDYVAYMLLTNWIAVLALGLHVGQQSSAPAKSVSRSIKFLGVTLAVIMLWTVLAGQIDMSQDFPFKLIVMSSEASSLLITSIVISGLYASITSLVYCGTQGLANFRFIEFLARNTLFVFIVHMPLIYAVTPLYYYFVPSNLLRIPINLVLFFLIPAIVSEYLFRLIDLKQLRNTLYQALQRWFHSSQEQVLPQ